MLYLDQSHIDDMMSHAHAEDPLECCGILAGKDHKVTMVYPVTNSAASSTGYFMEPKELLVTLKEIDDNGFDVLAMYHSHSHTEAYPSVTDVEMAYWPEPLYIIISLLDKREPTLRAFYIKQGRIEESRMETIKTSNP